MNLSIHSLIIFISRLITRRDTDVRHIHEQNDSLVLSRKNVVSSANCDNNISSSRMNTVYNNNNNVHL